MNILIVGGNGFIGKYLTERLLSFDHTVSIIDITKKPKNFYLKRNATYYQLNASSKECSKVFSIGQFDIVYFVIGNSDKSNWLNNGKELSALLNILNLSHEFKIKKFIYISTSYLYTFEVMNQETVYNNYPDYFLYCTNKKSCETYCNIFKNFYNLNMLIIRIPPIYGPEQNNYGEGSILINIFDSLSQKTPKEIYSLFKNIEFVYISDVARTLTSTALAQKITGSYSLKGDLLGLSDVVKRVSCFFPEGNVKLKFKYSANMICSSDENSINRPEDNIPHLDGFKKTYEWYKNRKGKTSSNEHSNNLLMNVKNRYRPWIEAAVFSFLVVLFNKYTNSNYDLTIVLVMIVGLFYGINVSLFAGSLCMIIYYMPFYKPVQIDLHALERLFAYLSIAFISGYGKSVELKSKRIESDTHIELEKLFDIVQTNLADTRKSASLLAEQIKTCEYSYSTLYNAIKKLNANGNRLIEVLPDVVSDLTGFNDVTVETRDYLSKNLPSIDNDIIKVSFEKNEVYFNTRFKSSIRVIIPVFNENTNYIDSLIVLRNIPFEKINMNYETQMHFIHDLVTDFYNNTGGIK